MRHAPPLSGSERQMLEAFLDFIETLLRSAPICPRAAGDAVRGSVHVVTAGFGPAHGRCGALVVPPAHVRDAAPDAQHTKQNGSGLRRHGIPLGGPDDLETYHAEVVAARAVADLSWISWPPTGMATASACVGCICT